MTRNIRGFTLIELSIVIVVIGLIVAGVVGGQALVRQAKMRNMLAEVDNYRTATYAFKAAFNYLPGDLPTATSFGYVGNGNGNGKIVNWTTENVYAWNHLANAEFIAGTYTGAAIDGTDMQAGTNIPNIAFDGTAIIHTYIGLEDNCISTSSGALFGVINEVQALAVGATAGTQYECPRMGFLTATEAYGIDKKIDDGEPDAGRFFATNDENSNTDGSRCVDNTAQGTGGASYDLGETGKDCSIIFRL